MRAKTRLLMLVVATSVATAGCSNRIEGSRVPLGTENEANLLKTCREVATYGDYAELKRSVDLRISEILRLSDRAQCETCQSTRDLISAIVKRLEKDVESLKALGKPEWNRETWQTEYAWKILPKDFQGYRLATTEHLEPVFRVLSITPIGLSMYGNVVEIPSGLTTQVLDEQEIHLRLLAPSTTFELCQLSKTIVLGVRVKASVDGKTFEQDFALTANEERIIDEIPNRTLDVASDSRGMRP